MKFRLSFPLLFLAFLVPVFAHDPSLPAGPADAEADIPLGRNYLVTFTFTADGKEQKAELITSRRGISFDLVDDPEHTFRFKGQLRPEQDDGVTLVYNAILITMVTNALNARQVATTSGEGAILLRFDQSMTIVRSDRQKLAVAVRPFSSPAPTPTASSTSTQPSP